MISSLSLFLLVILVALAVDNRFAIRARLDDLGERVKQLEDAALAERVKNTEDALAELVRRESARRLTADDLAKTLGLEMKRAVSRLPKKPEGDK